MNIGIFNYLFGKKAITEEAIRDFVADNNAKRICFSRIQTHALWKTDEGEDIAHSEDTGSHSLGVELLEIVQLFAHADELYGLTGNSKY